MRIRSVLVMVALLASSVPALAQKIGVKSATPSSGAQGTLGLDVVIAGNGFGPGAQARFVVSGTDDPDGISVRATRFVSPSQLVATIDIADTASLASFDIKVTLSGRTGKGTDLFQVVEKASGVNACVVEPLDTSRFHLVGTLNSSLGGSPRFVGFGSDIRARRVTLTYAAGSRDVLLVVVARGEAVGRVEIFFLDPATGQLLDGTPIVPGGPVQPHITVPPDAASGTSSGGQLAIGDVNGDGLPDFVSQHNGGDRVTLMMAGRDASGVINYSTVLVPPPSPALKFGFSAAMGDLTGDGRDEIVLVRPFYQQGKTVLYPRVHVYTAPLGTPTLIASAVAPQTQTKAETFYGVDVTVGDVTGDGFADVLVAAPRWSVGSTAEAGAIFIHAATGDAGVLASTPVIISSPSPHRADHFANRVEVANLDGDPSGQLDALALDGWDSPEVSGDVASAPLLATGQTTVPTLRLGTRPGLALGWGTRGAALSDLDTNGLTDIVVGAPNAPDSGCLNIGIAYVYLAQGTPAGGTTGWAQYSIQPPDTARHNFGWATAAASGSPLLFVSETGRVIDGVAAGQVYIYRVLP
jgi:hypothetical protein